MLFVSLPCRSALALSAALAAGGCAIGVNTTSTPVRLDPAALPRVGEVDARYQSYNVEMLEVTGGNFWRPYGAPAAKGPAAADVPAGMAASLYAYRAPIDLANPRLRMLASALAPAYVRVSGTWANIIAMVNCPSATDPRSLSTQRCANRIAAVTKTAVSQLAIP